MKKIFIIASTLSFFFVSAQQQDLFDVQKYIKNKNAGGKESVINPLSQILKPGCGTIDQKVWTLSNGNKVYTLPQSNMPCIVPDMSQFNMPNIATPDDLPKRNGPRKIPNPMMLFNNN